VETFKRELANDTSIKPQSRKYRLWCLGKLQKTWPELWEQQLDEITSKACIECRRVVVIQPGAAVWVGFERRREVLWEPN
jgi:hypothetical protein